MSLFVMLTRLEPQALKSADDQMALERRVADKIKKDCRQIEWRSNLAVSGPYDYLDVFEAPDSDEAMKVAGIVRAEGEAQVEIWLAKDWQRFKSLMSEVA